MQRNKEASQAGFRVWALLGLTGGFCASALAQGHYPSGLEGMAGGSWPGPGFYVRDYNYFYYTDRFNDSRGNRAFDDFEVFSYANAIRPIWVANFGVLGGQYSCDVILPFVYTDSRIGGEKGDTFSFADIYVEPLSLSWRRNQFDAVVAYGFWAPTGESLEGDTSPGLGQWTHMFTAGGVWYPTEMREWSLSILARYEINTEADDLDLTPGDMLSIEWGLGYAFNREWKAGLAGYYQRQITTSSGSDSDHSLPTVVGLGPEVAFRPENSRFDISLRYAYECLAEERSQGHLGMLTVSYKF